MVRVTADSNIYISAFQFRGKPLELLTLAGKARMDLAISDHIIDEVSRTLRQKFDWPEERVQQAQRIMATIARRVVPSETIDVNEDDPSDNRILECGVEAGSQCIVSGDKDLLRLGGYGAVQIVRVANLLNLIQATE